MSELPLPTSSRLFITLVMSSHWSWWMYFEEWLVEGYVSLQDRGFYVGSEVWLPTTVTSQRPDMLAEKVGMIYFNLLNRISCGEKYFSWAWNELPCLHRPLHSRLGMEFKKTWTLERGLHHQVAPPNLYQLFLCSYWSIIWENIWVYRFRIDFEQLVIFKISKFPL